MSWHEQAIRRLKQAQLPEGGWGYGPRLAPAAEPTALAGLALSAHDERDAAQGGLRWLAQRQNEDGGVAATAFAAQPCWPTALALLAWQQVVGDVNHFRTNAEQATRWLLRIEGKPFKSTPAIYGHDTRLIGWPWVDGTHSWIEPTAYAVLALRASNHADDERVVQAVSLFHDRSMAPGGWNYGNSRMFGSDLRPFPAQTGMVLAALTGYLRSSFIDSAHTFLRTELPRIRAPLSLAWGLIGMTAWGERPDAADTWLEECAERVSRAAAQPVFDALLLLAGAQDCPLIPKNMEIAGGV